jgi:hypothetical protein
MVALAEHHFGMGGRGVEADQTPNTNFTFHVAANNGFDCYFF